MVLSDDSRCCTATPSSAAASSAAASSALICMGTAKGQPSFVNKKNLQQKIALPRALSSRAGHPVPGPYSMSRLGEVKNTNPNVAWIDERGTWWFYIGMLALSRYAMFVFGFSSEAAWCAVISSHALITYWLIHYKVT